MKISMQRMPAILAVMAMTIFAFTFTACSDEDEPVAEVTYSYGFSDMSASHPDFLSEMSKIENAFKSALGITATPFTKSGAVEECDRQVHEACKKAFDSLKGEAWQGDYTFQVTNVSTGKVVCTATFSADNENFNGGGGEDVKVKTDLSTAKVGDYYTADGTLIEVPEGTTLPEELKKKIIGIVFFAKPHSYDKVDYTRPLTENGPTLGNTVHGYVVALQDANDFDCKWGMVKNELGLYLKDNSGNKLDIDIYQNAPRDWNGYAYTQIIINAAGGKDKLNATTEDGYPATYYAVVDYEKKVPAPANSSGWFLPSIGQMWMVYQPLGKLKFAEAGGSNLKKVHYWSSSESYYYSSNIVLNVDVSSGLVWDFRKNRACYVRAVLAF